MVASIYAVVKGGNVNPAVVRLMRFTPGSVAANADPSGLRCARQNSIFVSAPSG